MQLIVTLSGTITTVYDEALPLASLGEVVIRRASHVEPDGRGMWYADLAPVGGVKLGPFPLRSLALAAEREWLDNHLASLAGQTWQR